MRILFIFFLFQLLTFSLAQANILDKVQIEETIQRRIEHNLMPYDKKIRARVKFIYKSPTPLPGTTMAENDELTPNVLSESDVRGIQIEIYSQLPSLTAEMQNEIYNLIPIRKNRIKIKFLQFQETPLNEPKPLIAKDFWDIYHSFLSDMSRGTLYLFGSLFSLLALFSFVLHRSRLKHAKENFGLIAQSISEHLGSGNPRSTSSFDKNMSSALSAPSPAATGSQALGLSVESLKEFFADCYWTEEDGYAHWMWQSLTMDQKKNVIEAWPKLKKYSAFFISKEAESKTDHAHPYYLAPENLHMVSQEIIEKELKKSPDIWLRLSPLRQRHLNLPISEKLRVVKKGDDTIVLPALPKATQERALPFVNVLGRLNFADEATILKKPDLVPNELKSQLPSLVWLSLQKSESIEDVLSRFDALSLASAWVGAPEVLAILESQLPEKKRKMLHSYLEKVTPSVQSETYRALCEAGISLNAA